MNRLELCQRLIEEAMKCLENGDKECVMRTLEELIKAECHNGNAVGKETANKVRDVFHKLWSISDNEYRCELLVKLKSLNISIGWVEIALRINAKDMRTLLTRCGIDWKYRIVRSNIVRQLEDLLRERFGWSEARMCEEMWRFVGVDVDAFRKHGVEPCVWLEGLESLRDLRRPYWFGLRTSDLTIEKLDDRIKLKADTTNSVGAVFFAKVLSRIQTPSLTIGWKKKAPMSKYVSSKLITLSYRINLRVNDLPWPIELSANELESILDGFSDEELAEFVAGTIDGDGTVWYDRGRILVGITVCKKCQKSFILDALKRVIAERFGIVGTINHLETDDALVFRGESAVRLLRLIRPFVHHPLRRLRIELILALYDGRISREAFEKLYKMTEYEYGGPDIKRNHALEALAQAAPQTHTHGGIKHKPKN